MEGISSLAESQAHNAAQANMIAIQSAAAAQKRTNEQAVQQTQEVQPTTESASASRNPEHMGNSVDTYA